MPVPVLDFWFDFASTYSYLAAMRIGPLAEKAEVRVQFRPFLLGPIFKAQGWTTSPFNLYPAKGRHMWRDLERSCAELQLPFRRPDPFPQNSLLAARVALVGLDQAWGEPRDVSRAIRRWTPDRRCRDRRRHPDGTQARSRGALAAAQSDAIKTQLRAQTEEAQRLGVFGAPSFTTADGELFWGNDRLEPALRWAKAAAARS